METLKKKKGALKHVEVVDKSGPVISADVVIKPAPQKAVFAEIGKTHELKHVETVDKSAPIVEPDVVIKPAPQKALFAEIAAKKTDDK